jgi:hypothetical protein
MLTDWDHDMPQAHVTSSSSAPITAARTALLSLAAMVASSEV